MAASGSAVRLRAGLPGGVTNCSSSSSCTRDEGNTLSVPSWSSWVTVVAGFFVSRSTLVELDSNEVIDGDVGVVVERIGDGTGLPGVQTIEEVTCRVRPRVGSTTAGGLKSACVDG